MAVKLASLREHYWQLESGEARHAAHPDSFWIPARAERERLHRGQAARLLFELEAENEDGGIERGVERMWVIVAERVGDTYIGILDNQPAMYEPADDVYLVEGAEIPFRPEHVIGIDQPPPEYVEWRLGQPPTRMWPREGGRDTPTRESGV